MTEWKAKMEQNMKLRRQFLTIFLSLLCLKAFVAVSGAHDIFTVQSTRQLQDVDPDEIHEAGWCSMYEICGQRADGLELDCPNTVEAVTPSEEFSKKVQSLCPTLTGNVCCTEDQFDLLRSSVQQAVPFLVGCPACLRNFLNLYCELSCSPDQSLFIDVVSINRVCLFFPHQQTKEEINVRENECLTSSSSSKLKNWESSSECDGPSYQLQQGCLLQANSLKLITREDNHIN